MWIAVVNLIVILCLTANNIRMQGVIKHWKSAATEWEKAYNLMKESNDKNANACEVALETCRGYRKLIGHQ